MNLDQIDIPDSDIDRIKTLDIAKCISNKKEIAYRSVSIAGSKFNIDTELLSRINQINRNPGLLLGARNNLRDLLMDTQKEKEEEVEVGDLNHSFESTDEKVYSNQLKQLSLLQGNIPAFDLNIEDLRELEDIREVELSQLEDAEEDSFDSGEEELKGVDELNMSDGGSGNIIYNEVADEPQDEPIDTMNQKDGVVFASKPKWHEEDLFVNSPLPLPPRNTADKSETEKKKGKELSKGIQPDIGERIKSGMSEVVERAISILKPSEGKKSHNIENSEKPAGSGIKSLNITKSHSKEIKENFKRSIEEAIREDGCEMFIPKKTYEEMERENEDRRNKVIAKGKNVFGKNLSKRTNPSSYHKSTSQNNFNLSRSFKSTVQEKQEVAPREDIEAQAKNILMTKSSQQIIELSIAKNLAPEMKRISNFLDDIRNYITKQDKRLEALERSINLGKPKFKGQTIVKHDRDDRENEEIFPKVRPGGSTAPKKVVISTNQNKTKISDLFGKSKFRDNKSPSNITQKSKKTTRFSKRISSSDPTRLESPVENTEDKELRAERIRNILEE